MLSLEKAAGKCLMPVDVTLNGTFCPKTIILTRHGRGVFCVTLGNLSSSSLFSDLRFSLLFHLSKHQLCSFGAESASLFSVHSTQDLDGFFSGAGLDVLCSNQETTVMVGGYMVYFGRFGRSDGRFFNTFLNLDLQFTLNILHMLQGVRQITLGYLKYEKHFMAIHSYLFRCTALILDLSTMYLRGKHFSLTSGLSITLCYESCSHCYKHLRQHLC